MARRPGAVALFVAALGAAAAPAAASGPRHQLDGVWTLGSYTDLERPRELKSLNLTPAEAEAYEAARRALHGMKASKVGEIGQAESEFTERGDGLTRVRGQIRSSWIIDPPDGRIPYTPAALARLGRDVSPPRESFDNPEQRPGNERCVSSASAGAPMLVAPDANLVQILQTRDAIVFETEKYHDVRVARFSAPPAPGPLPPSWLGESRAHWEGATLVVETSGFRPGFTDRGNQLSLTGAARVTERFTRLGPRQILYAFTVDDPTIFTRPWRAETVLTPAPGRIFEYACHEGNYGLPGVLAGARHEEAQAAEGKAP